MRFLKKFNEDLDKKKLFFYAFDWDDNILHMPTQIMVQTIDGDEIGMSTSDFALNRSKIGNVEFKYKGRIVVGLDYTTAFRNFRDDSNPGVFKKDVVLAIQSGSYGPAWRDFIECLTHGSIFAIITARGHESEEMRMGVEYIIDDILSDAQKQDMYDRLLKFAYKFATGDIDSHPRILRGLPTLNELVKSYLDLCHFVGVSAPSRGGSAANPEAAKENALKDFVKEVNEYASRIGYKAEIGFSDDDPGNIRHMIQALSSKDLNHESLWPFISKIVIIDTNKPQEIIKTNIPTRPEPASQDLTGNITETSNQAPGLESSVLSCTQFGNMGARLNPTDLMTRQNDFHNQMTRQVAYLTKTSKDLRKDKKKKPRPPVE